MQGRKIELREEFESAVGVWQLLRSGLGLALELGLGI